MNHLKIMNKKDVTHLTLSLTGLVTFFKNPVLTAGVIVGIPETEYCFSQKFL